MAIRIDVIPTIPDARAKVRLKGFREIAGASVAAVHIADSYTIDSDLSQAGLEKARAALTNLHLERSVMGRWFPTRFSWGIEIGFLPGVTDNIGTTAQETIEDATKRKFNQGERIYSSQTFFVEGDISEAAIRKIATSLHNPLIQRAHIFDAFRAPPKLSLIHI